jgi:hypothetical protein
MSTHRNRIERLRSNARAYALWRAGGDPTWRSRIERINKALTEEEIRALVEADDGGLQDFVLSSGRY